MFHPTSYHKNLLNLNIIEQSSLSYCVILILFTLVGQASAAMSGLKKDVIGARIVLLDIFVLFSELDHF